VATRSKGATVVRSAPQAAAELDLRDPRWLAYAGGHPQALSFHRPEWAEALEACYGYYSFVFAAFDTDGKIAGGVPICEVRTLGRRRWVALPFADACPPLLRSDDDHVPFTQALCSASLAAGIRALDVRAPLPEAAYASAHTAAVMHTLELDTSPEELFRRFHRSQVQRNIRRAEREQVIVRRAETREDVTRTYYRLHAETRRRLGAPVQPRRFFAAIWELLLQPELGHVLLAYSGARPIAGAVFLNGTETMTYKYGASDSSFWHLRPNHLIFWTAIRTAAEQGFRRFDFGRSDFEDKGLRSFKSGWGAAEGPLVYTTISERSRAARGSGSTHVVRAILRRSPTWVSRAAGELLYRYAA
jgi:CelD/BcsL family acetyltransferase involved in cellulose biosynthesis